MFNKISKLVKLITFSTFILSILFAGISASAQYDEGNITSGSANLVGSENDTITVNNPLTGVDSFVFKLKGDVNGTVTYTLLNNNSTGTCGSIPGNPLLVVRFNYDSVDKQLVEIEINFALQNPNRDTLRAGYCNSPLQLTDVSFLGGSSFRSEIPASSTFVAYQETGILGTVRTGAANLIRDNLTLTILATIVSSSVVFSLFKKTNKGLKVSR